MWVGRLRDALARLLEDDPDGTARRTLTALLGEIRGEKRALAEHEANAIDAPPAAAPAGGSMRELVTEVLEEATGLADKEEVRVEVISPLVLDEARTTRVEDLLGGEFLGHFGGFLDERLRMTDFVLGYRSTVKWMETLGERGLDEPFVEEALEAARSRYDPAWDGFRFGRETLRTLPFRARWRLYRLGFHTGWLSLKELIRKDRP